MSQKILVTGGAGYIGSHTVVQLLTANQQVVVLDNFSNSTVEVIHRIQKITGKEFECIKADIRDRNELHAIFTSHDFSSVLHFAGVKAVGESELNPLKYYDNNVVGSIILLEEMIKSNVKKIVFSSSATVYGDPSVPQYSETTPLAPVNVYGRTKKAVEDVLRDLKKANPELSVAILRYFNPVGAHESGNIGENPLGSPNNLMPFISQVAAGVQPALSIYGNDYPTPDGTGCRDYIHVDDLARGHLLALEFIQKNAVELTLNFGTGKPYSVLEVIAAFEKASGITIPYEFKARRPGDLSQYYADPSAAYAILGWKAMHGIEKMCEDAWRWQQKNPTGYETP